MRFAWILSMSVGFLSLSQEILWVRYAGFAYHAVPQAFSFVLAMYLLGIAAGAAAGKWVCSRFPALLPAAGIVLVSAGTIDMLGPLAYLHLKDSAMPLLILALLIFLCSGLKGVVFPIAHHLGSVPVSGQVAKSVSRVYFFNILGSTLGPLITGFVLLDMLTLQQVMLAMGWLTVWLGICCLMLGSRRIGALAGVAVSIGLVSLFGLSDQIAGTLAEHGDGAVVQRVIQNKSGILHVLGARTGGDIVFGGNVYDGRTNIDPRVNSNMIHRALVLTVLKPDAQRVLVIGLSTGAWTRLLSGFPNVTNIDVVEINPGYLQLIEDYPHISPVLRDPRVHVHIDDGRRWLKRNPDARYDLVVMNTTFHWRTYSTNLLSTEFLQLVKRHMNPGAVIEYNATGSADVLRTAETVFPHVFRYVNSVIASDHDFRPLLHEGDSALLKVRLDGRPLFDVTNPADRAFIRKTLSEPFVTVAEDRMRLNRDLEVITDWNMITEYKYGKSFP